MNLYFDSAYIAKCYLPEPGAEKVRALARSAGALVSSSICIAELACVFQRQIRDCGARVDEITAIREQFHVDVRNDVWRLLPVTDRLLYRADQLVSSLGADCLIRAGDAIHLASAIDGGFDEIWTNDRRLLAAAQVAGLHPRVV